MRQPTSQPTIDRIEALRRQRLAGNKNAPARGAQTNRMIGVSATNLTSSSHAGSATSYRYIRWHEWRFDARFNNACSDLPVRRNSFDHPWSVHFNIGETRSAYLRSNRAVAQLVNSFSPTSGLN
jgi:hypothetical protein